MVTPAPTTPPPNLAALLLQQLEDYAYPPNPPPGLKIRLVFLMVLAGIALIGAILHFIIIVLDVRRRGGREAKAWWLTRWANLPSGRYIVTNTKIISAIFSLINLPLIIADLHNVELTSFHRRSQILTSAFRSLPNVPLLLHITILTYGQLQSYTLSGQSARLRRRNGEPLLSDHVLNYSFLAVLAATFLGVLVPAVAVSIIGARTWGIYENLIDILTIASANWTGNVAPSVVTSLATLKSDLDALNHRRTAGFTAAFVVGVSCCLWLALVNAFALILPFLIRRSTAAPEIPIEETHYVTAPSIRRLSVTHSITTSMEKSDLQQLAAREVTRREDALQLADRELMLGCSWLFVVSSFCFGLALSILASIIIPDKFNAITWARREVALTMVHWLYTTLHLTIFPLLLHRAWINLNSGRGQGIAQQPINAFNWLRTSSRQEGASASGLVRVKVVVEETEDLKVDDTRFGRLETVIEGGRRGEEDLELGDVEARGGGLQGVVEWQKPAWAANLDVPQRPAIARSCSSSSSLSSGAWRKAPDLPHITTTQDAAIPWEWSAAPRPKK